MDDERHGPPQGRKRTDEQEPSVEEMWEAIEGFGIDRKLFERSNPTLSELRNLYFLIKDRRSWNERPPEGPDGHACK